MIRSIRALHWSIMGNKHSVHHVPRTRRQSLMKEEFDFPQPAFDFFDDDWEIYHVEVELKILPPNTRHRVKIHVHEYTQEIISEECSGEVTPSETLKDHMSQKECSREIASSETEKNHVCKKECSWDINLSETEKTHVYEKERSEEITLSETEKEHALVDQVSRKKPQDESGLRPACFRDTALSSTSTDVKDRTSTVGIRLRDGQYSTKCSQCQCVIETGSWQADVSNENPTNKNIFSTGYDVSNENLTNTNIFDIECSQDEVSNEDLTDTNVASREDQGETDCVSNDVFLQWELSLEEPCCREDGNMKACRTKVYCDLNQLRFAGQDASGDRNSCSPDDRDVATTVSTVDQCDAERDVFPNAISPEAISSNATSSNAASSNDTSSNAASSNATSSNDTPSNATSSNDTSSNATSSSATSSNATSSNATSSNATSSNDTSSNATSSSATSSNATSSNATSSNETSSNASSSNAASSNATSSNDTIFNATSSNATSSNASSSNATSSNATFSNDATFNATSSLKCSNQKTTHSAGLFPRLCDTCSSSATQNTTKSLPVEIPTASAMLPQPEPEESLPMDIQTASTMLRKPEPEESLPMDIQTASTMLRKPEPEESLPVDIQTASTMLRKAEPEKSVPMEIPTASTMLCKAEPEKSVPMEIPTASTMLCKAEPEKSVPMEIPTASTMLCKARPHLRSARRKMSDPVLRLKASTPVGSPKLNAKPRKFSLKDDPGWIPNPLDSDSDGEDMEDSGVFSDSTGSPRSPAKLQGSAAAGFPSSPRLAARMEHYTATVSSVKCSARVENSSSTVESSPRCTARVEHSSCTAESSPRCTARVEHSSTTVESSPRFTARVEHSSTTADCTAAPEPPLREYPTAGEVVRKRLALQTGGRRRRYNSEPTPVAPKTASADTHCDSDEELASSGDSRPSSVSDDSTCSKSQSRWRLVKLIWGRRASQADAGESGAGAQSSSSGKEDEQQQEDLDQQLEWMTEVPGSEPPTPSEDREAVDFGACNSNYTSAQDPPSRRVTFSDSSTHHENPATDSPPNSSQAAKLLTTSEDPEDQGQDVVGQELELDWLCEPEWNNFELELFWSVLRPHMEQLLERGDAENLPDPCDTVFAMDAGDHRMLDRCLLHVQWHIWKGNYCQAVSDFRAVRRHFRCCAESHLIQSETRDDVENLRLVFQRKRPSRFRFWI